MIILQIAYVMIRAIVKLAWYIGWDCIIAPWIIPFAFLLVEWALIAVAFGLWLIIFALLHITRLISPAAIKPTIQSLIWIWDGSHERRITEKRDALKAKVAAYHEWDDPELLTWEREWLRHHYYQQQEME